MKKEMILGILRHTLTFVGGLLVMRGYVTEETMLEITGGVLTLTGSIWSLITKQ
jgi:hypothetical protein